MSRSRSSRAGFSLAEILVVLAIFAILAAVMVPVLTGQLGKSDASRGLGDLNTIETGVSNFLNDVRRYPGDLEDLSAKISATDSTVLDQTYPPGLLDSWRGPYIDRIVNDGDTLTTAFNAGVLDDFTTTVSTENGVTYLTVVTVGIAEFDFYKIDQLVDGDTASAAGRLLWTSANNGTMSYLAVPVN